jgi:5-methylcytosine-specific restriction endonuclease McrA
MISYIQKNTLKYMKTCSNIKCKQINPQPLNAFSKEKGRKDGLQPRCKGCHKEYRLLNREKIAIQKAIYRELNKEEIAADQSIRYKEDRENRLIYAAIYGMTYKSENKEELAIKKLEWRKSKPGLYAGYCAKRRAKKLKATPPWLTEEQWKQIQEHYNEAARLTNETGIVHEVDHIEPLQGKEVSGLHVPWNLQVLTKKSNQSKGNKTTKF